MRRTLLIIHPGTLGDVLLSLPAIRSVRRCYPSHDLGLLAKEEVASLLRACGEIEAQFPLEGAALTCLLSGPDAVQPVLHEWLSQCDLAVCWMKDPGGRLASTLRSLGVPRSIVASPRESGLEAGHQTERFLQTLAEMGSPVPPDVPLDLPESLLAGAEAFSSPPGPDSPPGTIVLHPGSGSPHKCAPASLFARLAESLTHKGFSPLLVGGPADDEALAQVARACVSRPRILQGLDLLPMAGVLARADLFVGHDSGLTHLAAALHMPTIALFGPTDPRRWGPRGPQVTVVTGTPCQCRGWESVQACRDKPCLQIPFEPLLNRVERVLQRIWMERSLA